MLAITENGTVQLIGLGITLITAGLIPYMISKNTKQHKAGTEDRVKQTELLESLQKGQSDIRSDIEDTKKEVLGIKEDRVKDKGDFLKLYERVIHLDAEHKRNSSVVDSHGSSSSGGGNGGTVAAVSPAESAE